MAEVALSEMLPVQTYPAPSMDVQLDENKKKVMVAIAGYQKVHILQFPRENESFLSYEIEPANVRKRTYITSVKLTDNGNASMLFCTSDNAKVSTKFALYTKTGLIELIYSYNVFLE